MGVVGLTCRQKKPLLSTQVNPLPRTRGPPGLFAKKTAIEAPKTAVNNSGNVMLPFPAAAEGALDDGLEVGVFDCCWLDALVELLLGS